MLAYVSPGRFTGKPITLGAFADGDYAVEIEGMTVGRIMHKAAKDLKPLGGDARRGLSNLAPTISRFVLKSQVRFLVASERRAMKKMPFGIFGQAIAVMACLAPLGCLAANKTFAENIHAEGTAYVTTTIRPAEECGTGAADKCKTEIPCFSNIYVEGESAKQLYEVLKYHGIKTNRLTGEYVGTRTDSLTCQTTYDGKYSCVIGYDGVKNVITEAAICQYD